MEIQTNAEGSEAFPVCMNPDCPTNEQEK